MSAEGGRSAWWGLPGGLGRGLGRGSGGAVSRSCALERARAWAELARCRNNARPRPPFVAAVVPPRLLPAPPSPPPLPPLAPRPLTPNPPPPPRSTPPPPSFPFPFPFSIILSPRSCAPCPLFSSSSRTPFLFSISLLFLTLLTSFRWPRARPPSWFLPSLSPPPPSTCAPSCCRCRCRCCKPNASPPCPSPSPHILASKAPCAGGGRGKDGALKGVDPEAISSRSTSDSFSSMAALSALKAVFIAFKRCVHRPGASIAHGKEPREAGVGVSGRGGGDVDAWGMKAGCRGARKSGGCESRFLVGTGESGVASPIFS